MKMFHGGTNFGLSNGAIWKNYTAAFITSYDYGAPLGEDGRTTDLYFTLRETIQNYTTESLPEPPANVPRLSIPEIALSPELALFDTAASETAATSSNSPLSMEELGQSYGFVLYEHQAGEALDGVLQPGDRPRDRVIVYVNGARVGVVDNTYLQPKNVSVRLVAGDVLQLLVENLGRVDYWSLESDVFNALLDPYKGIVGNVTVGGVILEGWTMTSFPLDDVPSLPSTSNSSAVGDVEVPVLYSGTFSLAGNVSEAAELDTFVTIPNGVKGIVWVNGFNLGRYWVIGPQQSLYLPGTVLKAGQTNEIVILELEPGNQAMTARGEGERVWGNNPDPDYL